MAAKIPHHMLNVAEIGVLESQEDKTALIKFKYETYSLAEVCRELKVDYKKDTRM